MLGIFFCLTAENIVRILCTHKYHLHVDRTGEAFSVETCLSSQTNVKEEVKCLHHVATNSFKLHYIIQSTMVL